MGAKRDVYEASSADEGVEEEDKLDPGRARACTDCICVPVFIFALVCLSFIMRYAFKHGDINKIYHGIDWNNNVCGVSESVKDDFYLYYCSKPGTAFDPAALAASGMASTKNQSGASVDIASMGVSVMAVSSNLELKFPICVSKCPNSTLTTNSCYQKQEITVGAKHPITGTYTAEITYQFDLVQDYPSHPVAHRYCMPSDNAMMKQLKDTVQSGADATMYHMEEVIEAWRVLIGVACMSIILGYLYFFLVKVVAGPLIYACFGLSSLFSLAAGAFFLYGVFFESANQQFRDHYGVAAMNSTAGVNTTGNVTVASVFVPTTGNKTLDAVIGFVLLLLGVLIPVLVCCLKEKIELILGALEATVECLIDMPCLLIQPVFGFAVRAVAFCLALIGLVYVVSVGDVKRYEASDYMPSGVLRTFDFEDDELPYLFGYMFIAMWIYEFIVAWEQIAFCYATQSWFFAPYVNGTKDISQSVWLVGFVVGITYHMGTLVFGSLILAIFRIVYLIIWYIHKQLQGNDDGGAVNAAARGVAAACMCCIACVESLMRYINKQVYLVVVVNSNGFCIAAQIVVQVMLSEMVTFGMLEGATKAFQVVGGFAITGLGAWITWLVITTSSYFTDPHSRHFIASPEYVTIAAGVICAIVAGMFMNIFDVVSDSILMCACLDKKHRKENGLGPNECLPPRLRALLGKGSKEHFGGDGSGSESE